MNAIKVAKRSKTGGYCYHWLPDGDRTACGRRPAELQVVEQLELETLPPVEACGHCVRTMDGWQPDPPGRTDPTWRPVAEPRSGRLRTTGPLSHGFHRRGARGL
jgi:hypothetical protein